MKPRDLTRSEQFCISDCIIANWRKTASAEEDVDRDRRYEACLNRCAVCG